MKDKYGTRLITFKELKIDLDKYCPNGIPDEKLSKGMKQGTNINNFAQYKGGLNQEEPELTQLEEY